MTAAANSPEDYTASIRADERERCAAFIDTPYNRPGSEFAAAIRNAGVQEKKHG